MTASLQKKQSELCWREIAEEALRDLSDKDRVHFALRLILDTRDPQAVGCVSFAAAMIGEHASTLMRVAFGREYR